MRTRVLSGWTALALAAAMAAALPAHAGVRRAESVRGPGQADGSRVRQRVRSEPQRQVASSWQTDGTVWALASAKGVVYVGGGFTSVRPPGVALNGTGQVARSYLAAFNASTGALITTFAPTFTLANDMYRGRPVRGHRPRGLAGRQHPLRRRHLHQRGRVVPRATSPRSVPRPARCCQHLEAGRDAAGACRSRRRRTGQRSTSAATSPCWTAWRGPRPVRSARRPARCCRGRLP